MIKKEKTGRKKACAQAIVEGCVAFVLIFLIFMFIIEFALYFQSIHANQTLSDDIGANISAYNRETLCTSPDTELIELIENSAKRYLEAGIELNIDEQNDDVLILKSSEKSLGRDILAVKIICADINSGYIVRTSYLYRGFFALKAGLMISSISNVQTPRF